MTAPRTERLLFVSALLALHSFGLMAVSALPGGAIITIAIVIGLVSLALYGWATLRDMNKAKLFGGENETETRGS